MTKTITVEVKPSASQNKIEKITDLVYKVWVTAPPVGGKANDMVIKNMAKYLSLSKSQVEIRSGKTSRNKVLTIYG